MISGGNLVNLSQSVGGDILNLDDDTSGAVYQDENGDVFYVLSPPSGNAWVCHLATKTWGNDTNVNTPCFCVNDDGQLLGPVGGIINRYYHPDYNTDNGTSYLCKMRQAWLNLRSGNMDAKVRKIAVQTEDMYDECTLELFNQNGSQITTTFVGTDREVGIGGVSGRLFSALFTWYKGNIESLTYRFLRRRGH
ncbi:hypothetical protein LCGC14_2941730 [marine sediment metagenome]|uniref:Uncharacterized protein n=1 Tax=marine sediment metagenome TaxID=412755 RepID=A0A0F8XHR5_9ZZZZ